MSEQPIKPGWKSTEFLRSTVLQVLLAVIFVLRATGVIDEAAMSKLSGMAPHMIDAAIVGAMAVIEFGYAFSRAKVKAGAASANTSRGGGKGDTS